MSSSYKKHPVVRFPLTVSKSRSSSRRHALCIFLPMSPNKPNVFLRDCSFSLTTLHIWSKGEKENNNRSAPTRGDICHHLLLRTALTSERGASHQQTHPSVRHRCYTHRLTEADCVFVRWLTRPDSSTPSVWKRPDVELRQKLKKI